MSAQEQARRTAVEISFGGRDITTSIRPFLASVTYTDNEADEADDLQIRIHDRENVWMCQWLDGMIDAAGNGADGYRVTAGVGLNVRSGPGTEYRKLGALAYGTALAVVSLQNGWAEIQYQGKKGYVSAAYLQATEGSAADSGRNIQCVFAHENWRGDGTDRVLDCGRFELDTIKASGPPATIVIKATALPYSAQIRQTRRSKAWEACRLSQIAGEMAEENGMACLYLSAADPLYERVEQFKTSDIDFLSDRCHDAGISLKVTNNILVLFDQADFEAKEAVRTIKRGDGSYIKYSLDVGTADTKYASCRVSYTDPATGRCISGTAYGENYKEKSKKNQQLEISARVGSTAEAKALAQKRLRLHNKFERTASFTFPGDPDWMAGVNVTLEGWGAWDGRYIIGQAQHTVGDGGYTVQVKLRRALEGY